MKAERRGLLEIQAEVERPELECPKQRLAAPMDAHLPRGAMCVRIGT